MCRYLNCSDVIFRGKVNFISEYKKIEVGSKTIFGKSLVLTAIANESNSGKTTIKIGNGCNFGDYNHITSVSGVFIGSNVLTGRWVTITDNSHGDINYNQLLIDPSKRDIISQGDVYIEDRVWIGDKATILPGVRIGEGCIIGANCVVSKDLPPYSVCVGSPARIIKSITH